jgi:hypothetical protein
MRCTGSDSVRAAGTVALIAARLDLSRQERGEVYAAPVCLHLL